eukprot:GFUD01088947.1.p1 GENE.GFUD01088947.1~~GFUD01088947.1.p1  ORF type:complete len:106 (-),score=12.38 GFUD01088947.1:104-397(-)
MSETVFSTNMEERQMLGIFVVIGSLLLLLAITTCLNKMCEGYSAQNIQNRRVSCQFRQQHHVPGCHLYLTIVIIQPDRGFLPDYQTVIKKEEEELPT